MKKAGIIIIFIMLLSIVSFTACSQVSREAEESNQHNEEETDQDLSQHVDTERDDENSEATESTTTTETSESDSREIVTQNAAFQIFEPAPDAEVKGQIIVRGLARVYEATVLYEFEDGHFMLDEGFTTAEKGAPEWGEFEFVIDLDDKTDYTASIIIYEESAEDGSRINELVIPVIVTD